MAGLREVAVQFHCQKLGVSPKLMPISRTKLDPGQYGFRAARRITPQTLMARFAALHNLGKADAYSEAGTLVAAEIEQAMVAFRFQKSPHHQALVAS